MRQPASAAAKIAALKAYGIACAATLSSMADARTGATQARGAKLA